MNKLKIMKFTGKKKKIVPYIILSLIIFAQAIIIAKLYTKRQENTYTVNLVKINEEKDSIDYPQMKENLADVDALVSDLHTFLASKNITDEKIETLRTDSLGNAVYLAKASNRYSQYLVNLQARLSGIPLGIPTEGYISSQFGKRKNPIPVTRTTPVAQKSAAPAVAAATPAIGIENGKPYIVKIRDSMGNVTSEITVIPKLKPSVTEPAKSVAQNTEKKTAAREENNAPGEADQIQFHKGIDIGVAFGTDVKAAATGMVIFAGEKGGYGNCVIISHGNGLATLYGHLSQLLVKADQRVNVNQVIAKSGNSGRSTGPHLHYEVHKNNVPVNPKLFLNF